MTATTTTEVTEESLRERIASLEKELPAVEREIRAATVDGKSTAAPTKRLRTIREEIRQCEVALEELQHRKRQAEEETARGEASGHRCATYAWLGEYLARIETYVRRRDEFEAAERELLECLVDTKFQATKFGYGRAEESDLDTGLIGSVPDIRDSRYQRGRKDPTEVAKANLRHMTPGRARDLRALARQRAEEERSGNGVDRSQERDTWNAEQREQFEANLAALAARSGSIANSPRTRP